MDLVSLLKVMLRRWPVVLPIVILTGIAAVLVNDNAPRQFEVSGTVLLATPDLDSTRLPGAVVNLPGAVSELTSPAGTERLVAAGATENFSVRRVSGDRVEVRVRDDSPRGIDTAEVVLEHLADLVIERQEAADLPVEERLVPLTEVLDVEVAGAEGGFADGEVDNEVEVPRGMTLGILELDDPTAGFENPFGANDATAQVIKFAVESDEAFERLKAEFGTEDIEFEVAAEGGPGIMSITALGPTPEATLLLFDRVTELLSEQLSIRQERAGVPSTQRVEVEVLAEAREVTDVTPPVDRAVAATVGLGGILAVGLVLLVENLAPRWTSRRRRGAQAGTISSGGGGSRPPGGIGGQPVGVVRWVNAGSSSDEAATTDEAYDVKEPGDLESVTDGDGKRDVEAADENGGTSEEDIVEVDVDLPDADVDHEGESGDPLTVERSRAT